MTFRTLPMIALWACFLLLMATACGVAPSEPPDGDDEQSDADAPDGDASPHECETDEDCEVGESCVFSDDGNFCEDRVPPDGEPPQEDGDEPQPCAYDWDCTDTMVCSDAWCVDGSGIRYDLSTPASRLIYRNDTGRVDVVDASGAWIVRNAAARILLDATDRKGRLIDFAGRPAKSVSVIEGEDRLGSATRLVIVAPGERGEPEIHWILSVYGAEGFYTSELLVRNTTDESLTLAKTTPFWVDAQHEGGLFLGESPATHRVLENGSFTYFDYYADIRTGDAGPVPLLAAAVPGNFEGDSVSTSNHCVKDLASDTVWVAGLLNFDQSSAVINLSYDPDIADECPDGRKGFSHFSAEAAYQPKPKLVGPGEVFHSERYYFHPTETNPFEGLERYAEAVKREMSIILWTERDADNRVPGGWNSWTTSGSTGGYGTNINEEIILENLDVMADEFRDWGIEWFQIDDGYEPSYGDWWWREDRFPNGPAWLAERIREKGLRPGLWMAAFTHHEDSQVLAENPHWFAEHSVVGKLFSGGYSILDLTHPEVQDYLRGLFYTFRHEWGFEWLKLDFSYYALFGDNLHDSSMTREEAYRSALRIIREQIGEESFFLAVSALGPHLGLIDSNRLSLDNMPVWDKQPQDSDTSRSLQQGFKPTVRTAARRYYLHNRVWINHADLIVFRSNTRDESWPRVTLNESQAFCSYVGLTGGIVKMGDRLVDLEADHINTVRKLLPIYGKSARPLDLFEREFPERWHMKVDSSLDGYAEAYDLVGFFNWGRNWDLTQNPFAEIPDSWSDQSFELSLSSIGLAEGRYLAFEFWTQEFLGIVEDSLRHTVPSHSARVIALRPLLGRPQLLGWNRQITMGATDILSLEWDDDAFVLTLQTKVAKPSVKAPFRYSIAFHVPTGLSFKGIGHAGIATTDLDAAQSGGVLTVEFTPEMTGELTLVIEFERP